VLASTGNLFWQMLALQQWQMHHSAAIYSCHFVFIFINYYQPCTITTNRWRNITTNIALLKLIMHMYHTIHSLSVRPSHCASQYGIMIRGMGKCKKLFALGKKNSGKYTILRYIRGW